MSDLHSHGSGEDEKDQMHPAAKALFGWVGYKRTPDLVFYGLIIASILLIAVDFVHDRHGYSETEEIPGFYAIYGFVAFSFVVLAGIPLGKLLRRDENYYGDADTDEEDTER